MNRTFRFIIKSSSAVVEASVRGFKYIARGDEIFSSLENEGYMKVKQGVRSQLKRPNYLLSQGKPMVGRLTATIGNFKGTCRENKWLYNIR